LGQAARELEHLREHGKLPEERADEKSRRKHCPTCGRPLPWDSHVCNFCVDRLRALKRLASYLAPYKLYVFLSLFLNVSNIGFDFVPVILAKTLIDRVFPLAIKQSSAAAKIAVASGATLRTLTVLVLAIIGASLVSSLVGIWRGRIDAYLGAAVLHDIRAQLYTHLQRLSVSYYDKREVGAVMSRVQNDVSMLQNFLMDSAEQLLISGLTIVAVVVIMFSYSPLLCIGVLLPVPFVVIGTQTYWRGLMKLWRRVWHQNSSLGARLADALGGVRVIRAFGAEEREVSRFVSRSSALRDASMRVEQKAAVFNPVMGLIMGFGMPITWYMGGRFVLAGELSFGTMVLFLGLLPRLYGPVQQLTRLVNQMTRSMTAAERVFEVLDTEPEVQEAAGALPMPHLRGEVEFREVVFGYEKHRPVLKGISLKVEPGEMIGLVGHSGAGKSTLINLLLRFYDVTGGQLLVDGLDIRDIRRDDLRRQIGVVLQESYLFHGSIFDNIVYGHPGASPAEVMDAAKAAFAHDFIVSFPDGYDTLVGERGTRLSGGERQRIAIARAILHDPRVLILDEATASVDTQTEAQIQKALANLVKGRTTFAIAHRLSTLRHADRLVVVDKGKIAEVGTHDELMAKKGTFYKLVQAQQAMNEITVVGG